MNKECADCEWNEVCCHDCVKERESEIELRMSFPIELVKILKEISVLDNVTVPEVVRNAIGFYKFVRKEVEKDSIVYLVNEQTDEKIKIDFSKLRSWKTNEIHGK